MNAFIQKYKLEIIGGAIGAVGGWAYWYFVGCSTGTCAITSSPVNSSLYGMLMGGLLLGAFKKETNKEKTNQ